MKHLKQITGSRWFKKSAKFMRRFHVSVVMVIGFIFVCIATPAQEKKLNSFSLVVLMGSITYSIYSIVSIKRRDSKLNKHINQYIESSKLNNDWIDKKITDLGQRADLLAKENIKWREKAEAFESRLKDMGLSTDI